MNRRLRSNQMRNFTVKNHSLDHLSGVVWIFRLIQAEGQLSPVALSPAQISIMRQTKQSRNIPVKARVTTRLLWPLPGVHARLRISVTTNRQKWRCKNPSASPDNFEGMKVRAWLLLGHHEFAKALEVATRLNKQVPDDITVYGYLVDANAELGNYSAAENAAQWMLNLWPGNIAGLTRGAYLRELYGNLPGAIELMKMAYDATAFQEKEDRAWILTQIAHIYLISGDLKNAETYAKGAL